MTGKSSKAIVAGILVSSATATANLETGHVTCNQIANLRGPEFAKSVAEEFQLVHGLNLDWNAALEVSDDEEGNNIVFSSDGVHSIHVPLDGARFAAPNKIDVGN